MLQGGGGGAYRECCGCGALGGGYSGIFRGFPSQETTVAIAGGGGGGASSARGGAGGGLIGQQGSVSSSPAGEYAVSRNGDNGGGGGQKTGGADYAADYNHGRGMALKGGMSMATDDSGSGGGGYFGGSGGKSSSGGGGGGSSFVANIRSGTTEAGHERVCGAPEDLDRGGAGNGGKMNQDGSAGKVVIYLLCPA
eukprot:COSAG02_NODE_1507_length_12231_cov_56.431751_11_plen_195_part_00